MKEDIKIMLLIMCSVLFFIVVIYLNLEYFKSPLKGLYFIIEYKWQYLKAFILLIIISILGGTIK